MDLPVGTWDPPHLRRVQSDVIEPTLFIFGLTDQWAIRVSRLVDAYVRLVIDAVRRCLLLL